MQRTLLLLKSLRILEWRAYLGIFIYGYILSGSYSFSRFCLLNMLFFIYMASIYVANNIYDVKGDSINPNKVSKNPFTSYQGQLIFYKYFLIGVILMGLVAGFFILDIESYLIYVVSLLIGVFYSMPPFRFKERFILDILSHSLFFGVFLLVIPFKYLLGCLNHLPIMLSIAVYSMILELRNEIEDYEFDAGAGYSTTAVRLGYRRSLFLLFALILVFFFLSIYYTLLLFPYNLCMLTMFPFSLYLYKSKLDFRDKMRILDLYTVLFLLMYLFSYEVRVF